MTHDPKILGSSSALLHYVHSFFPVGKNYSANLLLILSIETVAAFPGHLPPPPFDAAPNGENRKRASLHGMVALHGGLLFVRSVSPWRRRGAFVYTLFFSPSFAWVFLFFFCLPSFLLWASLPSFSKAPSFPPSSFFLLPTAGEEETRFYSPPFLPFLSLSLFFFGGGEGDVNRVRFFSHECPAKLANEKRGGEGRKKASLILFSIVQINLRVPYTV